jgi:hypothetical protein
MKTRLTKILSMLLVLICFATMLVGCAKASPSVAIGFKITDSAAEYQESIDAFEIGKTFYTCIKVKVVTNKKKIRKYRIVVEVPRTNNVEVDQTGGLEPNSQIYNAEEETTKLEFSIKGSKTAVEEKILFKGTPVGEGDAKILVTIYNEDGEKEYSCFRTVEFKYELQ